MSIAVDRDPRRRCKTCASLHDCDLLCSWSSPPCAALKLVEPAIWPMLARHIDASQPWGKCQGLGAVFYPRSCLQSDVGHNCPCPSRKFPCLGPGLAFTSPPEGLRSVRTARDRVGEGAPGVDFR